MIDSFGRKNMVFFKKKLSNTQKLVLLLFFLKHIFKILNAYKIDFLEKLILKLSSKTTTIQGQNNCISHRRDGVYAQDYPSGIVLVFW